MTSADGESIGIRHQKWTRYFASFGLWMALGILLRIVAINQPLLDAHLVRQTQTADWTYNAFQENGWPLSAAVSWRGDTGARLVLEFPLYNYLVVPVWKLTGNLDLAGKMVSILLWAFSFGLLQKLWQRWLTERQAFYANSLFVLAPLSVFFGQAFMPEMCIQLLAFLFLHQLLRYSETGHRLHYAGFALAGLLGLMVKSLEISHLYAVALLLFWKRDGWKLALRPEHWIGGAITLIVYSAWTGYVDRVNAAHFGDWTASELWKQFLGTWSNRLNWHFYVKVGAYLAAFVAGPVGLCLAGAGLWQRRERNQAGFWWFYSLFIFYFVWGIKTAGLHSYYNLPALGPICFLFGLSMPLVLDRIQSLFQGRNSPKRLLAHAPLIHPSPPGPRPEAGGEGAHRTDLRGAESVLAVQGREGRLKKIFWRAARAILLLAIYLPLIGCSLYLFRQDRTIYEAAAWIKENSQSDDLVTLRVNHRRDNNGYPEYPVFSYYAKRKTWIDTDKLNPEERARVLLSSKWAVLTHPPQGSTWAERMRDKIARYVPLEPMENWPPPEINFEPVVSNGRFTIFRREPQ